MLAHKTLLALWALAAVSSAAPVYFPKPTMVPRSDGNLVDPSPYTATTADLSTAPAPTPAPSLAERADPKAILARAPQFLTFHITNKMAVDVSTSHVSNAGSKGVASGKHGVGVIKVGQVGSFAVPTGWMGNVALVQAGGTRAFVGDESLIEASFVQQMGSEAQVAHDVSYVNGYSVGAVCWCEGGDKEKTLFSGCTKNLWSKKCPQDNGKGSCKNPTRPSLDTKQQPTEFFAPCRGLGYTFPKDDTATTNGPCPSRQMHCCIGNDKQCPKPPKQK